MPEQDAPRIVALHATPVAMAPVHAAFGELWPEAELVDLLDSGLTLDRQRTRDLTDGLIGRFVAFAEYGHGIGADGILVTCSAFGPAIDKAAAVLPVPVVKPNEAMFRAALTAGSRIAMLATFGPSVPNMTDEFAHLAGPAAELHTVVVDGAMEALRNGDGATHDGLVAAGAVQLDGYDAIMLAHFSTARAAAGVRAVVGSPVLTAPEVAVRTLRSRMADSSREQAS